MIMSQPPIISLLNDDDLYLFNQGSHFRLYEKLGAHLIAGENTGTYFAVWAPDAEQVFVLGDFNQWHRDSHALMPKGQSGIWEGFFPDMGKGALYKYRIVSRFNGYRVDKADPLSIFNEVPPKTASIVWDLDYTWGDREWMAGRHQRNRLDKPMAIYEMHLGSWRRIEQEGNRSLSYRELAPQLADYLQRFGYTHVELLPVMDHPFFGWWGYQITGFFAPSGNFGTPQDLMYLIDYLHQRGIGVILDWVPSHFPSDEHGPAFFDGTHLYEHADSRQGYHPEWNSFIFNYARNDGEWVPNKYGGRENIDAIDFLRRLNAAVYEHFPDTQTLAEESTDWPMVSRPTYVGGLGFGLKWDMGWMHDTLQYMCKEPVHRRYHQDKLTFRMLYAFHENFVLPLSHDEVVYGKGSLLGKMSGDLWQKFANLRLLFAYMYAQPAKKLLFMGGEFGQWAEWSHDSSLEWNLLEYESHRGLQKLVADLNSTYRNHRALHELDCDPAGFEWIDGSDSQQSVLSFMRKSKGGQEVVVAVFNFTPIPRHNYRVGVPRPGHWREIFNSDSQQYGGADFGNLGGMDTQDIAWHGKQHSLNVIVPPLGAIFFK